MTFRDIPAGAIKIAPPAVPQPDDYSCGPSSLMSIAGLFGVAPESLEEMKIACKTNPEHGTYYGDLAAYANTLGLVAEVRTQMTADELRKLLDEGIPVIISFQAWADDPSKYDDPNGNNDGHFAVAIGYDDEDYFYFMDPSVWGCMAALSWTDLDRRWHENEGTDKTEISDHLGIVVRPGNHKPVYTSRARIIG